MNLPRRTFFRFAGGAGAMFLTAVSGLLKSAAAWAAPWNKTAFEAKAVGEALKNLPGDICDNLFNPDPYYSKGGDMVRVGGLKIPAIQPKELALESLIYISMETPSIPPRHINWRAVHLSMMCQRAGQFGGF